MADNYWGNMSRAVLGQGLAMGWGDELEAKLRTMSGDETYEEELNMINDSYNKFSDENTGAAMAGEIAGGFVPLIGSYLATGLTGGAAAPAAVANSVRMASILNKIRQGTQAATQTAKSSKILNNPLTNNPLTRTLTNNPLTRGGSNIVTGTGKALVNNPLGRGFTAGTTTGFVDGAGAADQGERVKGGLIGSAFGGTLGLGLPITGRTIKSAYNFLLDRNSVDPARIDEAALKRIFSAVTEEGGSIQDVIDRIDLDRSMNIKQSTIANASDSLSNQAELVFAGGVPPAPSIIGKKIEQMQGGAKAKAVEQVKSKLKNVNYYDQQELLIEGLRRNAAPAYKKAFAFGVVDDPRIMDILQDKDFKAAYEVAIDIADKAARSARNSAKTTGIPFDADDFKIVDLSVEGAIPDVRTLDFVKRGIDDLLNPKSQKGIAGSKERELRKLKNVFVEVIDEVTEDADGVSYYRDARKLYKGDLEVLESLEMGLKDFQNMAPEEVDKILNDLSSAEAETFVIGATRSILDKITKPRGNSNYAQNVINGIDDLKKLKMLFPDTKKGGFDLLESALLRESQLYKQANKIIGGSQTQRRQAGVKSMQAGQGVGDALADGLETTLSPTSALLRLATNALRRGSMSEEIQASMAKKLMSSDPDDVASVVKALQKLEVKNTRKVINLDTNEVLAVSGSANVLSEDPKEKPSTSRAAAR